jgi:dUTP pyrophosphatase
MIDVMFKLSSNAWLPKKGSRYSAGYDIHAVEDTIIPPHSRKLISTGVSLHKLPKDNYIRVAPRSGLAVRNSIDIGAGVIDPDYRGEIKVVMINHGKNNFYISKRDRIAQLIVEKFNNDTIVRGYRDNEELVEEFEFDSEREDGGFGSTGLNVSALDNV